nr:MAG TPA: hypothetical protein [Caudoviricetes sp.]
MPGQGRAFRQPLEHTAHLTCRTGRSGKARDVAIGSDIAFWDRSDNLPYALGKRVLRIHSIS